VASQTRPAHHTPPPGPALPGFGQYPFAQGDLAHVVYTLGDLQAPPVIVLQELPGIGPGVIDFARRLASAGFQVHLPWLFGPVGRRTPVRNYLRLCISREFGRLAAGVSAPVTDWLRGLVTQVSACNGDRNVAAIGMCVSGGFVIPLLLHPRVAAAVAAQPAMPLSLPWLLWGGGSAAGRAALNVATPDLAKARERLVAGQARLLAVRCRADRLCPVEKLERLQREFPAGLTVLEYGAVADRNSRGERPHATYTKEFRLAPADDPAHHARQAFDDLLTFLRSG
jgi:dienelactone hydrolase